ncbi:MAG: hypothetical protein HY399_02065 [Elusimicrobia bacterium]|nr:hypothetical protein [Elusimicrobiota bacterium]
MILFLIFTLFSSSAQGQTPRTAESLRAHSYQSFVEASITVPETLSTYLPPPSPSAVIQPGKPPNQIVREIHGNLLGTLNLTALHNSLWKTPLHVELGHHDFSISGQESGRGHRFITLYDHSQNKVYFLQQNVLVFGKGYRLNRDGKTYRISIDLNFLDHYGSKLSFEEETTGSKQKFSIRDIMKAMYDAGKPVEWGSKSFRVHYTDQIIENKDGTVQKLDDPLLVLMVDQGISESDSQRYQGDGVPLRGIPSSPEREFLQAFFRIKPYGTFSYHLRKTSSGSAEKLEVYSP